MAKEDNLFEEGKTPEGKPAVNADKLKALRAAMDKIEKNYGKGSIMKLGDESIEAIEVVPTGTERRFRRRRLSERTRYRNIRTGIFR